MKKNATVGAVALAAVASLTLGACTSSPPAPSDSPSGAAGSASVVYEIAITQFLAHPSLDLITKGFKEELAAKGLIEGQNVNYTFDDAQGENSNTATIAGKYAADPKFDLIFAIATPSAAAVATAVQDRPVLFGGVTDPVAAGIVPSWDANPQSNVTGTSDLNPEGKPLGLIQEALAGRELKSVGFLYSLGEENSKVQLEALKAEAEGTGIEIVDSGITSPSELATGVQTLAGVDAIFVGTDNAVVNGIDQVAMFAIEKQIPLFTADQESVSRGSIATRGLSYLAVGSQAGDMAYDILVNGKKPGDIPPLAVKETEILVNVESAKAQGVTFPEALLAKATVVKS
ncbi:MAG: ABC transporter substrate-binding protein [Propionibacteriaceae bacterium]|jgi:putative ABC transport system substrate-binding protein|nr:ABC transporter substrate-binding protein [Propionibacteriaceae bacterium]